VGLHPEEATTIYDRAKADHFLPGSHPPIRHQCSHTDKFGRYCIYATKACLKYVLYMMCVASATSAWTSWENVAPSPTKNSTFEELEEPMLELSPRNFVLHLYDRLC